MAELLSSALVGAVVSELLKEVISSAKGAIRLRKSCTILKATVDDIVPLLKEAGENSANWNQAHSKWLTQFNALLAEAKSVTEECIQEPQYDRWTRMMRFWQWRKLPARLMDINRRIEEVRKNADLVTLGVVQCMNAASKATESIVEFVPQPTPPKIVGVENHFSNLKTSIIASHAKDKCSYLGLQGRGGAGKTLLAQMLHNDEEIKGVYGEHSILWITVGLDVTIPQLYERIGSLLNDVVYKTEYARQNLIDQRTYLRNVLAKKKVLLILDDVWEKPYDHHDMMYWLDIATARGSTTLITTRSKTVLTRAHAEVEVVLSLPEEESWELFCSYAFSDSARPSSILEEVAKGVCKECKGLPLALTVIGSAMLEKVDERGWKSALGDLKQSRPIPGSNVDDELFGRLQLSYNELKEEETKICFLYFAAFPEDMKIPIRELVNIWIAEGLFGTLDAADVEDKAMAHLEILVKRSLIGWDRLFDLVHVHDILRDLALYIIDKAKPGECAFECYFQVGKSFERFPTIKSLQEVKRMSFMGSSICEWPEHLELPNLRVCLLSRTYNFDKGVEISEHFFSNMQSLQYLDLSHISFNSKQKPTILKGLMSLKILSLLHCEFVRELMQSICELKTLTHLYLSNNRSLEELSVSISELKCLTHLFLMNSESLKELPKSIGELKCLTMLDLSRCGSLKELPESIGELKCLMELYLNGCGSLKELPESIGELKCLTHLYLDGCGSLKELPKSVGELKCLMELYLNGCGSLKELPESVDELKCLIELYLDGCRSLKKLPESIGELKCLMELDLSMCGSLKELPESIGKLKCLTHLYLGGCESLKKLPESIGQLKCLTHLYLDGCGSLKELPESIGELKCLTHLYLSNCGSLKELPESIGKLKCLMELHLDGCGSLKELPESIGQLMSLIRLYLGGCESLKELPESIGELKCLTHLNLNECGSLKELPESIDNLKCLTELNLDGCGSLKELSERISELKCLTHLYLSNCGSLKELPENIGELKCLTHLYLSNCGSLKELPESIGELKCLMELHLDGCGSLKELPESIGHLMSLIRLYLGGCESLKELLESIGELKCLTHLNLNECGSLKELPESIDNLKCLTELNLDGCESLKELPASIGKLKCLT